jgi:hypothetical protein
MGQPAEIPAAVLRVRQQIAVTLRIRCRRPKIYPKFSPWTYRCLCIPPISMTQQPLVGQGLLVIEASRSHSDTLHSVGLLWTSDQPDAETCAWQYTCVSVYLQGNYQSASTRLGVLVVINDCLVIYLQKLREENDLQVLTLCRRNFF